MGGFGGTENRYGSNGTLTPFPDGRPVAYVYALCEPDGKPRYVGVSRDPYTRLLQHRDGKTTTTREWVNVLTSLRMEPRLKVLRCVSYWIRGEEELRYIKQYKEKYPDLLNKTVVKTVRHKNRGLEDV